MISRSWKRETWELRTASAYVKCPSVDMSCGWVVATEDGKLWTTGKLFPSVDQGKVSFTRYVHLQVLLGLGVLTTDHDSLNLLT